MSDDLNELIQPSIERAVLTVRATGVDGACTAELRILNRPPKVVEVPPAATARQIAVLARSFGPILAEAFDRDDGNQVPELVVDVHGESTIAEMAFESMAFVAWRRADGAVEPGRRVARPAESRRALSGRASQPFLDGRACLTRTFGRRRNAAPAPVRERLRLLVVVGDLLQGHWDEVSARDLTADAVGSAGKGLAGVIAALAPLRAAVEIVVAGPGHVTGPWDSRYVDLAGLRALLADAKGWDIVHWIGHSDAGRAFHGEKVERATGLMLRFDANFESAEPRVDRPDGEPHCVRLRFADLARPLTGTRLLLLDACRLTPRVARELLQHFDHVVGHPSMVDPGLCAVFTPELMRGLAGPRTLGVAAAVREARRVLRVAGLTHGFDAPVHHAADPDSKGLVGRDEALRHSFDEVQRKRLESLPELFGRHFRIRAILTQLHVALHARDPDPALSQFDAAVGRTGACSSEPATLRAWLDRADRIVLLGDAGAGKSTTLKMLGLQLLDTGAWLPIYASLQRLLADGVRSLTQDLHRVDPFLSESRVERAIAMGRLVLLLDGLDEVGDRDGAHDLIHHLAAEAGAGRIVVGSRRIGYTRFDDDFVALRLDGLGDEDPRREGDPNSTTKEAFIRKWMGALAAHPRRADRYRELARYGEDLEQATRSAVAAIRERPSLHELCSNPLMLALTLLRWAEEGAAGLPERRHLVLREIVATLVQGRHRGERELFPDGPDVPLAVLRTFAEWMLRHGRSWIEVQDDFGGTAEDVAGFRVWARQHGRPLPPDADAPRTWRYVRSPGAEPGFLDRLRDTGVFVPDADDPDDPDADTDRESDERAANGAYRIAARFPIQPFADALAAESLVRSVGLPLVPGRPVTPDTELEAVQRLLAGLSGSQPASNGTQLARWAETLALVTAWLRHGASKDAWLRGLLERDSKLGLRALALAEEVPPETLAAVLEQGSASDRADYWTTIETTVGDPDAALGLLEHAIPAFPNPGDCFLIADAALRIAAADAAADTEHRAPRGERARRVAAKAVMPRSASNPTSIDALVEAFRGQWRSIPTPREHFGGRNWFWMGSAEDDESRWKYEHRRRVVFRGCWWAMEFPVTVSQWALLFPEHQQYWKGTSYRIHEWQHRPLPAPDEGVVAGSLPVTTVNWFEVQGFVGALNRLLCDRIGELIPGGAELWRTGWRFRMATEAEWEWMARAGSDTRYWWGDQEDGARAWWEEGWSEGTGVHPVRSRADASRNPFGLSHVHGLVWEWALDAFEAEESARFGDRPDPLEHWLKRGGRASVRAQRGGSYGLEPRHCRSACRDWVGPSFDDVSLGFRLVFAAPLPDSGSGIEDRVSSMV